MKIRLLLSAFVAVLALTVPARGNDVSGVLSALSYEYVDQAFMYQSNNALEVPGGTAGTFSKQFDVLGDTSFKITLTAPKGQVIRVSAPTSGFAGPVLMVTANTTGYASIGSEIMMGQFRFIRGAGSVPVVVQSTRLSGGGGEGFSSTSNTPLTPGQTFTFKGVEIIVNVSADYDVAATSDPINNLRIDANAMEATETADPGPWMSLIKDPSVTALERNIKKAQKKQKKLKKKGNRKGARKQKKKIRKFRLQITLLG